MAYPVSRFIIPPIIKLWLGKVQGESNIPKDKAFIVAANHTTYYDALLVPSIIQLNINKKMHALVNSDYWENPFTRFFLDMWGGIPVYVQEEKNSKQKNNMAIEKASDYLKKGDIMMIFPEGTRSHDGKLRKAYTGIAKLALKSKIPVLPMGVRDANKVLPKGKIFPRFKKCEAKIGNLMYFNKYYNKKLTKKMLDDVTRSIMKEIAKLIRQKYNY